MRPFYSYLRLVLSCWLFLGGIALQFVPSPATVERDVRWRERQMQAVPTDQRAQWLDDRDRDDARSQAYLHLFGVLMGGLGLAGALNEAAYMCGRYIRRRPITDPD